MGVGHRGVDVAVRPFAGQDVDAGEVRTATDAELAGYGAAP